MSSKEKLLEKLFRQPLPKNFTVVELNSLMKKCNCTLANGGRGSSILFYHEPTGRILQFDAPHPEKDLYSYQVKMVRNFVKEVNEM